MTLAHTDTQSPAPDAGLDTQQPGAETPLEAGNQPLVPEPGTEQPGTVEADAQPRTYTEAEWAARESAKDKEAASLRQMTARFALQLQAERVEKAEATAAAQDARAVDQGEITELDAAQRVHTRANDRKEAAERAERDKGDRNIRAESEQLGRIQAATDFAAQHGVDAKALFQASINFTKPEEMEREAKVMAREAAIEQREAAFRDANPEEFDGGGGGGVTGGGSLIGKSPIELAELAYSPGETARRNKQRRR